MPIFRYKCDRCGVVEERFVHSYETPVVHEQCNFGMRRLFSWGGRIDVFPAEGIFLKHVSPTGERFYSKSQMRAYARAHDLELGALL